MCLLLNEDIKHMAEEDTECYKVFIYKSMQLISPYVGMIYEINHLYSLDKPLTLIPNDAFLKIYLGMCSFRLKEGYYSFKNKEDAYIYRDKTVLDRPTTLDIKYTRIGKCIIPKGAHYYIDEDNKIVSDKIMVKEIFL